MTRIEIKMLNTLITSRIPAKKAKVVDVFVASWAARALYKLHAQAV